MLASSMGKENGKQRSHRTKMDFFINYVLF